MYCFTNLFNQFSVINLLKAEIIKSFFCFFAGLTKVCHSLYIALYCFTSLREKCPYSELLSSVFSCSVFSVSSFYLSIFSPNSVYLFVYLFIYFIYLFIYLFIYFIYLYIYLFIHLFIYLFIYLLTCFQKTTIRNSLRYVFASFKVQIFIEMALPLFIILYCFRIEGFQSQCKVRAVYFCLNFLV